MSDFVCYLATKSLKGLSRHFRVRRFVSHAIRVLVMLFSESMTSYSILYKKFLLSDWINSFAHAQNGCLQSRGHAISREHDLYNIKPY